MSDFGRYVSLPIRTLEKKYARNTVHRNRWDRCWGIGVGVDFQNYICIDNVPTVSRIKFSNINY